MRQRCSIYLNPFTLNLRMSLWAGIQAAQVELAGIKRPMDRLKRAVEIGRIILDELSGAVLMIPYGLRAARSYFALPPMQRLLERRTGVAGGAYKVEHNARGDVAIVRGVRYGPKDRNLMDLYFPKDHVHGLEAPEDLLSLLRDAYPVPIATPRGPGPSAALSASTSSGFTPAPLALFVHGGVWATGERWHYSPMATRLAESGVIACVVSYSLFPQAQTPQMVREVTQALDWCLRHAHRLQADPGNVSLVGHSAGAHLCAMALLQRAQQMGGGTKGRSTGDTSRSPRSTVAARRDGLSMPKRAVLISGVYDIERHYEYEDARGVATLSTMCPAVGGPEAFAGQSPAVLLAAVAQRAAGRGGGMASTTMMRTKREGAHRKTGALHGEVMATWAGLQEATAEEHTAQLQPTDLQLTHDEIRQLPEHVLLHSVNDSVVPFYETTDYYRRLRDLGVPAKLLLYNKTGHGDFVTQWWPRAAGSTPQAQGDGGSGREAQAQGEGTGLPVARVARGPRGPAEFQRMRAAVRNGQMGGLGAGSEPGARGGSGSGEDGDLPGYAQDVLAVLRGLD